MYAYYMERERERERERKRQNKYEKGTPNIITQEALKSMHI